MKYLFWAIVLLFVLNCAYAHEEHEHHKTIKVKNGMNGLDGKDAISNMPSVPYQFNPDSSKYQLSVGAATQDFNGNNSIGIAVGKRLCNKECESSFWHGGITTDGHTTGGNVGVTFSWE